MTTDWLPRPPSRLPEEPAYWDALAERILQGVVSILDANRNKATAWWAPLARLSTPLLVAAALAIALAVVLLPAPAGARGAGAVSVMERAVTPIDPLVGRLLFGPAPPSIDDLLLGIARREGG